MHKAVLGTLLVLAACSGGGSRSAVDNSMSEASIDDWHLTVYYTAVEQYHTGALKEVTGCLVLDCSHGDDQIGTYPGDFLEAVEAEGTGRITSGEHAGKYLNWSHDVGYWLDTAPRASDGRALEPSVSAAADPEVMAQGTRFRITDCGLTENDPPPPAVCDKLSAPDWEITDEFTPGLGGARHLDLYIGEEDRPNFTSSELFTTLTEARLEISD